MRYLSSAAAMALLTGATPPHPVADDAAYETPAKPWRGIDDAQARCRDRIERARAADGKPKLDRSPADPEKPLLIYAVDHKVAGCGVLVPVSDPSDIQHPPEPGQPEIIPAKPMD